MMKIPIGWKPYELGKAVNFNPQIKLQRGEQYSFIEMDDVNPDDKYVKPKEKKVYDSSSCSKFKNGDTLFARITPCLDNKKIGTAFIGEGQYGFGSTEFIILREKDGLTVQDYVHYLSKSEYIVQNAINSYVGASGRQRADAKFIKKVVIPLPKIPEQQRIASILSAYDNLIENNNKRIAILEQMAEQIYKEWFVRMRFPGNENAEFEKGVPKGWIVSKIGDRFYVYLGGTPSREKPEYWGGEIPWINSGKVNEKRIIDESEFITELGLRKSATEILPRRTTVLAITGATLGQVSILEIPCCANQSVVGIKDTSGDLDEYLFFAIHQNISNIINYAGGGAQQHINKQIVQDQKILIPNEKLILKFKNIIEPKFNLITSLMITNKLLKQTRDLLLPRLISGKLRVKDLGAVTKKEKV